MRGGYQYYVDDITVTSAGSSTTIAVDTRGNLNGTYTGSPSLGQPSLVDGEADTATARPPPFSGSIAETSRGAVAEL